MVNKVENIGFATKTDISACLELVYLVIDGFPTQKLVLFSKNGCSTNE